MGDGQSPHARGIPGAPHSGNSPLGADRAAEPQRARRARSPFRELAHTCRGRPRVVSCSGVRGRGSRTRPVRSVQPWSRCLLGPHQNEVQGKCRAAALDRRGCLMLLPVLLGWDTSKRRARLDGPASYSCDDLPGSRCSLKRYPGQLDHRGGQNPGTPTQAASVRGGSPGRVLRPKPARSWRHLRQAARARA